MEAPGTALRDARAFVAWVLMLTGVLLICVAVIDLWLDPVGATGRDTRFSAVENAGIRQAKLDLLEQLDAPPEVLVLGSSRSRTIDPGDIERTSGHTAFNAAVSGGTTRDAWLYTAWVRKRWGRDRFPHLVVGVVNDVFRDAPGSAALDPRLKPLLPSRERRVDARAALREALQLTTLRAAIGTARRVVASEGPSALLHPEAPLGEGDATRFARPAALGTAEHPRFDERGMQLFEPGDTSRPLRDRVAEQMRSYVERAYVADATYTGIDPRGTAYFARMIGIANRAGDVPTVWITPFQPDAVRMLPHEHEARDRRFRAELQRLRRKECLQFHVVDLSDISSFGGSRTAWYDGIHMRPENTRRIVQRLDELGEFDPEPPRPQEGCRRSVR